MEVQEWDLLHMLRTDSEIKLALVVVNQPLKAEKERFFQLWKKATFKATVDGGTNELYDNTDDIREEFLPQIITGDFDSVRPEVLEYYKEKGVEVVETPDEYNTDFTKSLNIIFDRGIHKQVDCIVAFGAFGGRVDQVFANIDTLFRAHKLQCGIPVYLMNSQSLACLLQKGSHRLKVDSGLEGEYCGLIPVAGKCELVKTTGLKWNLGGTQEPTQLCFGELISTSNTWSGEKCVSIETDAPILWTMTIKATL